MVIDKFEPLVAQGTTQTIYSVDSRVNVRFNYHNCEVVTCVVASIELITYS